MKMRENEHKSRLIIVRGLVQGVGFRPFIYRLAKKHGILGWVENRNDAVYIQACGPELSLGKFIQEIDIEKPGISHIGDMEISETDIIAPADFEIRWSRDEGDSVTEVSPDIAVCNECLVDMKTQPRRIRYPFSNCTRCGPRFSIIRDLPYDRVNTTMAGFKMCPECESEYNDIDDRRFHAQPVACNDCGPVYRLIRPGKSESADMPMILSSMKEVISRDGVVVAKGMGGFFMACDARSEKAVQRLRKIKNRYSKPFAVLFRDEISLAEYAEISETESLALNSWQRPVLILRAKKNLAPSVSMGFPTIGAMLPYLPFQYLMFESLGTPVIVFTSGNFSEEPILIDDDEAVRMFRDKADAILINDRPIHNRVDDSVGHVVNNELRLLRRSRGYVPSPVFLRYPADGLLAAGAELVNCFCIGKDTRAILSQHIGDLKNHETLEFYEESFGRFLKLFRITPRAIAHDLHPDYLSTRYALSLPVPKLPVQHHHAHIASCMAEHGIDEKVIGVSMDGTGMGDDHAIWGSEFMVCDLAGYDRITHFEYVPMPGGDLAVEKPWRMAVSYLYQTGLWDSQKRFLPFLEKIPENEMDIVLQSIEKRINTPSGCGAGRLFDTVAVLLGLLTESEFHAEAPMRLEAIAAGNIRDSYSYNYNGTIQFADMLEGIIEDMKRGVSMDVASAKFHNTIVQMIIDTCELIRKDRGIDRVVLSGGIFQNKYILAMTEIMLKEKKFNYYSHKLVPTNDGGIALGQLAILSKKQNEICV